MIEQASSLLYEGKSLIDAALEEEQECFDNLPEGIQSSDRGCDMETNIEALQSASDSADEAINYLEDIV